MSTSHICPSLLVLSPPFGVSFSLSHACNLFDRSTHLKEVHIHCFLCRVKFTNRRVCLPPIQGGTQTQGGAAGASTDASFTLFYGKFRMHAPRIKMLMQEIEKVRLCAPLCFEPHGIGRRPLLVLPSYSFCATSY
jgi:hypothetical protein